MWKSRQKQGKQTADKANPIVQLHIEGLQAETRVYYTLWQCGPELRILVSGEAGPAVRCTFPADMECRARNLLQYLYENTVMPSQAADVLADCCTVGQVEVLNAGC